MEIFKLTPQESIAVIFLILFIACISMVTYIIYNVIKNEKRKKKYKARKGDSVYLAVGNGGLNCEIDEIDDEMITIKLKVRKGLIYPRYKLDDNGFQIK